MSGQLVIATLPGKGGEAVRIALDQRAGVDVVDIRIVTVLSKASRIPIPTKIGLCLDLATLPELIAALSQAKAKAVDLGLLEKGGAGLA
ncbi:MAG: hypothetical protein B7Y81_04235 [Caulobacter sp. 32-67-35]|nr:MAG: hypothetical protein B7Y81_04235 [Caulobacter sp. 32-67-35]